MINRVILIIIDSVGIGEMPDSHKYGDKGVNTLGNVWNKTEGLNIPNLIKLGIGNIEGLTMIDKIDNPSGSFGRMAEASDGKDTITGHWEIAGLHISQPFRTYPDGFPKDIIDSFKKAIGTDILGNIPASGTEIIEQLGKEHMETGYPIIYTSADSVFQIAAHEDIIPLERLYEICEIARGILVGEHNVARVIARPFSGQPGKFSRTPNRKDYAVKPYNATMLDNISQRGYDVIAIGKVKDIYCGQGVTKSNHTKNNQDGIDSTIKFMQENNKGLIFTNLVDFDMLYGHRNDYYGYAKALEDFDSRLPDIISSMREDDVLIISADHGCDPTTEGTDHTREYVPVLVLGDRIKSEEIGTRNTFADLGATICDLLSVEVPGFGESFKHIIIKD